jgi:hypothetical protein
MVSFTSRKAILYHAGTWIIVAFILGALFIYLVAIGVIPLPITVCPH